MRTCPRCCWMKRTRCWTPRRRCTRILGDSSTPGIGVAKTMGAVRCMEKTFRAKNFPSFAAVAIAGLGWLPDTILSRSVIIRMKRRGPHESVEQYRQRIHDAAGYHLRDS